MQANVFNILTRYESWLTLVVLKTTALLLVSISTMQLLRKGSASLRHFLHSVALCGLLIIPVAALWLPELPIAVLPPGAKAMQSSSAFAPHSGQRVGSPPDAFLPTNKDVTKAVSRRAGSPTLHSNAPNPESHSGLASGLPRRARHLEDLSAPAAGFAANSAARPVFAGLLSNWREMLVLLWACGSLICLVRMLFVRLRLRALIRRAVPVESIPISSRLRWLCRDLGIHREITVLASDEIDVPIAAGILDPKIILSRESAGWDETRRTAVLCHELAHIKRLDALTQLIAGFATAMYWFNPLVWFTVRAMRLERERACDDYVLAHGTPASDYAHELVEIVSSLRRPQPAAALAMARRSQLEGRVLALLNPSVRHGMLARGSALAVVAGVVSIALPLAAATLQERAPASTANSSASAAPLTKQATPSASKNVIEEDTSGETRGAIERGVEGGIPGGIQSGMANGVQGGVEGGTQDGIREGVGAGYGRGSSDNGMPLYPGATVLEHSDGRGTVSLIRGAHVHQLQASSYLSRDNPQKVLQFYRDRLRNYGPVVECAGGTNPQVDFELDEASLRDPSVCRSSEFGAGGTEIKVDGSDDRRVVVTLPHEAGSEIALVRYQPAPGGPDSAWSQVQTSTSAPDAFHFGSGNGTGVGKGVNLSLQTSNSSPAPFDCFEGRHSEHSNISSHSENGNRTWTASWSDGECSIDAHSSGTVRFNADATAIESITPGGFFEVNERKGDTLRRLRVEPAANSQLSYTYKVNGAQQEFDSAARAWFSNFLLGLERVSGFAADSRVPALLKKGGPQAVLNEIAQLQSDYVRQVYFTKLFENATLPGPLLVKALDQAREDISTDYSLAQVLLTIAQKYDLNDEAQRTAFLNGANKLHTDYEHSRVLIELLKRPNLSPQILRAALESAKSIGTDYEKGRILTTLAGLSTFDEREINTYLDLASSIGTDYEHSRSLLALMEHQKLSSAAVSQILKSASTIGTDYEKSRILIATDGSSNFDEKQIATYLALVDSIGTDYERSRDLMALMHDHKLANDSLARIIAETQKIGTDYEKARVLTDVAERYQVQGALRDAYIKAADSIGTEYDRNRTLAAITKREMM